MVHVLHAALSGTERLMELVAQSTQETETSAAHCCCSFHLVRIIPYHKNLLSLPPHTLVDDGSVPIFVNKRFLLEKSSIISCALGVYVDCNGPKQTKGVMCCTS